MKLKLMQLRKAAGYKSRDEFAEALGVKPRTYKTWETGERNFTLEQACVMADLLKCSLDELAGRPEYAGSYSDPRQAQMNEIYGYLDEAYKGAAVGALQGIAANQAREKSDSEIVGHGRQGGALRTA